MLTELMGSLSAESKTEILKLLLTNADKKSGGSKEHPYQIGKCYLIRTVTMIQTGRLTAVYDQELVLEDAAWVADTGRFNEMLKDKDILKEVEPVEYPVIVGRGGIIDVFQWNQPLPRDVK